uniref:Uncharacterized protein n=1 Tax=Panagrolaimus sp. ES5 TaxID=591445 RepID=A0AC34FDL2_9BILA
MNIKNGENQKFTAQLYPNFEQNIYALRGIRAIASDERLLEKLWALEDMNIGNGPKIRELSFNNFIFTIASLAETSPIRTLICASSNNFVKEITLALQKAIPKSFKFGHAARIDTNHKYNPSSILSRSTVELSKIGNTKLKSFQLIICTLGLAPKLSDHGISSDHFDNIFIHNSQTVSELDAWMALGKLANVNTNIFICGKFDGKEIKVDAEILQSDEIGYRISIFERLYCLSSYDICDNVGNITMIEL